MVGIRLIGMSDSSKAPKDSTRDRYFVVQEETPPLNEFTFGGFGFGTKEPTHVQATGGFGSDEPDNLIPLPGGGSARQPHQPLGLDDVVKRLGTTLNVQTERVLNHLKTLSERTQRRLDDQAEALKILTKTVMDMDDLLFKTLRPHKEGDVGIVTGSLHTVHLNIKRLADQLEGMEHAIKHVESEVRAVGLNTEDIINAGEQSRGDLKRSRQRSPEKRRESSPTRSRKYRFSDRK